MWPWSEIRRLNDCIESRDSRIKYRDEEIDKLTSCIHGNTYVLRLEQDLLEKQLYIDTLESLIMNKYPGDRIIHDCGILHRKLMDITKKQKEINK